MPGLCCCTDVSSSIRLEIEATKVLITTVYLLLLLLLLLLLTNTEQGRKDNRSKDTIVPATTTTNYKIMDNENFPKLTSSTPSSLDASDEVEAVQNSVGRAFLSAFVV